MNELINLSGIEISKEEKASLSTFCESLHEILQPGLQSITLYGSAGREDYMPGKSDINLLVVVKAIDVAVLKSILDPVVRGRRYGIAPFFITEVNLRSSADVFPVKFLTMRESYRVLLGRDILQDLEISREHLRLRCEQEIKNLLLRLRRHYIMSGGQRLSEMMSSVIGAFLETLRAVLSLTQDSLPPRKQVIAATAKTFEFDAEILQDVTALRDLNKSLSRGEAEKLYDKFMTLVDKVAQITDQMNEQ